MVIQFLKRLFGLSRPAPYIRDFLTSDEMGNLPSGIFTTKTGEIALEFLWHGREIPRGQLVLFSLEGMEDLQLDSPQLLEEILRRLSSKRRISLGHLAIADLTEGARFGSWGTRFDDDRARGIQTFKFPPQTRFCFLLICNTNLEEITQTRTGVDRFCFSFLPHRFVDVTGDNKIFAFGTARGLYNSPVFCIGGAKGTARPLNDAIGPNLDWRKTPLGEELLHHSKNIIFPTAIPPQTIERTLKNSQLTEIILPEQNDISRGISIPADLIPSILAEHLKQSHFYNPIEEEAKAIGDF